MVHVEPVNVTLYLTEEVKVHCVSYIFSLMRHSCMIYILGNLFLLFTACSRMLMFNVPNK